MFTNEHISNIYLYKRYIYHLWGIVIKMDFVNRPTLEDEVYATRTALVLLASALEDRFEPGVLRERLEFLAEEADMHGAEPKYAQTSLLLITMAKNLKTKFPR
jgi:hypothetical protein